MTGHVNKGLSCNAVIDVAAGCMKDPTLHSTKNPTLSIVDCPVVVALQP